MTSRIPHAIENVGRGDRIKRSAAPAFTLIELMAVVVILFLLVTSAGLNMARMLWRDSFKTQAHEFVATMNLAARAAARGENKYELIIDPVEQNYLLREITTSDLQQVLDEEIVAERDFSQDCRVDYIMFDDGEFSVENRVKFRIGKTGWQYGGKIVLLDKYDQRYSVVVNRLNRTIVLQKGDVEILTPKRLDEVSR